MNADTVKREKNKGESEDVNVPVVGEKPPLSGAGVVQPAVETEAPKGFFASIAAFFTQPVTSATFSEQEDGTDEFEFGRRDRHHGTLNPSSSRYTGD